MMDLRSFNSLKRAIMLQGFDEATATEYAVEIGDTPLTDEAGNVLVMAGDRLIATLKPLPKFCNQAATGRRVKKTGS